MIPGPRGATGPNGGTGATGPQGATGPTGLTICTSATRPGSPTAGMSIYETDTGKYLQYQGATDTWTPPWDTAWGAVPSGLGVATSNQGSITTIVDISGTSVTWTVIAHRMYEVTVDGVLIASTSGTVAQAILYLYFDGAQIAWSVAINVPTTSVSMTPIKIPFSTSAGSHTVKARLAVTSGGGTMTTVAAAINPLVLSVKDVGNDGTAPS